MLSHLSCAVLLDGDVTSPHHVTPNFKPISAICK
jgi:hypothetical protein